MIAQADVTLLMGEVMSPHLTVLLARTHPQMTDGLTHTHTIHTFFPRVFSPADTLCTHLTLSHPFSLRVLSLRKQKQHVKP